MVIDSHHHLWEYSPEAYGWIGPSMEMLRKNYLPGDLQPLLIKSGVSGTVVVQARQSLEETEWLLDLAGKHAFIRGVVGWLDLCSPRLDEQLERCTGDPRLVGLRHVIHDEPDDDFMLRPEFKRGIGKLHRHDLVYDLLLFPKHLTRAIQLVRAFPDQRFVLDHLGKPPIRSGQMQPWETDMKSLAAMPNVWCKLSGMVTEADHLSWKPVHLMPYMRAALDAFGPERLMLGSDWPVCTLAGTYDEVMEVPLAFLNGLEPAAKKNIACQNAIDCYQLQT